MGTTVDVEFRFTKEKHARWAAHMARNLIKLYYAPFEGLDLAPNKALASMSDLCLQYDELLTGCDLQAVMRTTALDRMTRKQTRLYLDGCYDVYWLTNVKADDPDDFFSQLCFALARRYPQAHFVGYGRNEMTVSGAVQRTRASWNGSRLRFRQIVGERPLDEDAWDTWEKVDWVLCDDALVRLVNTSTSLQAHFFHLLDEAREAAEAGDEWAALRLVDDAMALPHCSDRVEALECRAEVGRSLRRRGVRRFVSLRREPDGASSLARVPFGGAMPLDVGTHELRKDGSYVVDVNTATEEVCAKSSYLGVSATFQLVGGRYLLEDSGNIQSWTLIDWDYEG